MNREQAYNLMTEMIKNPNLRKHGVAVEAIMRALCKYLKERVRVHPGGGSKVTAGPHPRGDAKVDEFDEEEWAIVGVLHDADYELSGLITACALVQPDKKLAPVSVESVMKKFKQANFAAGARRDQILACEKELEIPLREFVKIALDAMKGISSELGL